MKNNISIPLTVGGIYEVRGNSNKVVRFKFVHINSGKPTIEINGVQKEVDSIIGLIEPEKFQEFLVIDAPSNF